MGVQLPFPSASSLLRLTAEQLEAMAVRGTFDRLPRIELREGVLHQMSPQYFPHGIAKTNIFAALIAAVAQLNLPCRVLSEVSVRVSASEVPMPDLSVVNRGRYSGAVPVEQVRLVGEVSDTTLADDLGRKRALYAQGCIPEYWVFDLNGGLIYQFWAPDTEGYARSALVPFGQTLGSATIHGLSISTEDLRDDCSEVRVGEEG